MIDGSVTAGVVLTSRDIIEQRRSQQERARLAAIVESSEDAIISKTLDGVILSWNRGARRIYGYTPEEVVGRHISILVPSENPNEISGILTRLRRGEKIEPYETVRVTKDGRRLDISLTVSPIRDSAGNITGASTIARDITERKIFEKQLEHQAFYDALTDLPNRTLFMDRLDHALASLKRSEGKSVAVLFVDLDNFKLVNDSLGHKIGDQVLIAVARRLHSCTRAEDTVGRFGGDEFIVLLRDIEDVGEAVRAAERLSQELQTVFTLGEIEVVVSPSIGISLGTTAFDRADDLLRDADTALHQAKVQGKARHAIFDSDMYEQVLKRLKLEGDLRRALERDEFRVYYQPQMKLNTELQDYLRASGSRAIVARKQETTEAFRIKGTEALVRWQHPELGLISPAEFIPVAEETGLIVQIGRWVLEEACLQTRRWNDRHPGEPSLTVCVNLSARQFHDPGICQDVARVLQETGLDPRCLCLEITESVVMKDVEITSATLRELKGLGVKLAADDFGTGYSSLSYLKRFPVDYLKIDKTFVKGLGEDIEDTAIVRTVVELAHTFGMEAIAEGVETEGQAEMLRGMGCDFVQGYHFSKPLPPEDVPGYLGEQMPVYPGRSCQSQRVRHD
jgi:diguanylate cyclase (GGDEF)-like protein/PAS domain S-box-containing protein